MDPAVGILLAVNLVAGIGGAILLAGMLGRVHGAPGRRSRCFAILIAVYFVEGVALAMGMGIPVFSVGLAVVWGVVFARWLRRAAAPVRAILKAAVCLSLYTSLPALSFLVVPLLMWFAGWPILSAEAGQRFGIPGFLPWPVGTILGFYAVTCLGGALLKTTITTGEVGLLIRRG
ncbi:MAG TPA: hypothetical protein VMY37_28805 [Thermoguttaceae bacterium]|nr:hypothetical protein [Thermoguttaceae bacterium]